MQTNTRPVAPVTPSAAPGGAADPATHPGWAEFAGVRAHRVVESIDLDTDAHRLDAGGVWFVSAHFTGPRRAWRFEQVEWDEDPGAGSASVTQPPHPAHPPLRSTPWRNPPGYPDTGWRGPTPDEWTSSATADEYRAGVETIRARIADGDVYQVNLCRVLEAPLRGAETDVVRETAAGQGPTEPDAFALARRLAVGNPAPYAGVIHVPAGSGIEPVWVVSASPELFLERDGRRVTSGPIKGTAPTAAELLPKDSAENVMITDLVRNDLHQVCEPGSVRVERLLALEEHPGLVHLVSTVSGELADSGGAGGAGTWERILAATFPPASVAGAPKLAALEVIAELEGVERGPYCGAIGWIDADRDRARLAVGIRTFWWTGGRLRFGTGAGITWGSDPETEWQETELKARRLVGLASPASTHSSPVGGST